jgi:hypothetical protein
MQGFEDCFEHGSNMGEDVAIPEEQDPESIRSQKSIPTFIVAHLLDMLDAILLDTINRSRQAKSQM